MPIFALRAVAASPSCVDVMIYQVPLLCHLP